MRMLEALCVQTAASESSSSETREAAALSAQVDGVSGPILFLRNRLILAHSNFLQFRNVHLG